MRTIEIYLRNPDQLETCTIVTAVREAANGQWAVVLAETPFYPEAGGQAGDAGVLVGASGQLCVARTSRGVDDTVDHLGLMEGRFTVGETCKAIVDAATRTLHTRIHSGGELLCAAIEEVRPGTRITKANHRPGQASVTLGIEITKADREPLQQELEASVLRMIRASVPVDILTVHTLEEAAALCGFRPQIDSQAIRIVQIGAFARPCCGTHVRSTLEIGAVRIRSFSVRAGETRIGYDVLDS